MSRALTVKDREAIIGFEEAHLGMGEVPRGSNNTEPGRWYGTNRLAWCAAFQSWSFYETLGFSPFPASTRKGFASCHEGAKWFRRQGRWEPASVNPERGWLIFFTWPGDTIEHHIGLVRMGHGQRNVDTIEGNTSDRVMLHHRSGSIAGYGVIDYHPNAPTPAPLPAPQLPYFTRTLHQDMRLTTDEHRLMVRLQDLLRWQSIVHHAPRQNPGPSDGMFGDRTVAAWMNFKEGINAAMRHKGLAPRYQPVTDSFGPKDLGLLSWWVTR